MNIDKLGITPGPWEMMPEGIVKPKHRGAVVGRIKGMLLSDKENKANQILCSAAPEMLEALIYFCARVDNGTIRSRTTYNIDIGIIEKATNKSWGEIKELIDE